jgi:hypothetical protein
MEPAKILETLRAYEQETRGILSRFSHTRDRIAIQRDDGFRLRGLVTEVLDLLRDHVPGSSPHIQMIANYYNKGIANSYESSSYASVQEILGTISAVILRIERNPELLTPPTGPLAASFDEGKLLDALDQIVMRFHAVCVQLRDRHASRPTLDVTDEYDVQDLMHALLRLYFDDVRPEEWVPSYAGSASRTDFLLPQIDTIVEIKKTRVGLNAKAVGEQLIIDIAKYKKHPLCRRLVCFVYDPEGRIANPSGLESDLNEGDHGIEVRVSILPKTTV